MKHSQKTAALLIIGNEILSGRTQDKNLNALAKKLVDHGVYFAEARIVPDVESVIIKTVNELRATYDYVFTSGGIGPTHDDITAECIAKAFGLPLTEHPDAMARLKRYYEQTGQELNAARRKMAFTPEGAGLIDNPVSAAPGFYVENVYVMAGVPSIMQAMMDNIIPTLKGGDPILSISVSTNLLEGTLAEELSKIQAAFPDLDIGSYPHIRAGKLGVSLVVRGVDSNRLLQAEMRLEKAIIHLGGAVLESEKNI